MQTFLLQGSMKAGRCQRWLKRWHSAKSVIFILLWVLESLQHTFEICKQKSIIEICFPQKLFGLLELKLGWVHMRNRRFYSYFSFLKWITQIILTNEEPTLFYLEIKVHKYNFNYIRNAINSFAFPFELKYHFVGWGSTWRTKLWEASDVAKCVKKPQF